MALAWVASHPLGVHELNESVSQLVVGQVFDPQQVLATNGQYVGSDAATAVTDWVGGGGDGGGGGEDVGLGHSDSVESVVQNFPFDLQQ